MSACWLSEQRCLLTSVRPVACCWVSRFDLGDSFLNSLKVAELDSIGGLTFDEFWECLVLCALKGFATLEVRSRGRGAVVLRW